MGSPGVTAEECEKT